MLPSENKLMSIVSCCRDRLYFEALKQGLRGDTLKKAYLEKKLEKIGGQFILLYSRER